MDATYKNIIDAIGAYAGTVSGLAKKAGISRKTIYDIKNGTYKNIQLDTIQALAKALNLTADDLVYGYMKNLENTADATLKKAEVGLDRLELESKHEDILQPLTTKRFRVIGDIACGIPVEANEEYDSYVDTGADIKADYVFKARGDSMIGARIHDGDYVFIKACEKAQHRGIYAVSLNGEITLKRVLLHPVDKPTLISLQACNPEYDDIVVTGADLETFRVIGRCVAFQSDVK